MNKEKQRIAIAKACGLFEIMPLRRTTRKGKESPNGVKLWYAESHMGGAAECREVPRYPDDLNAMHEAIMSEWFQLAMLVFTSHVKTIMECEGLWAVGAAGANLLRAPAYVLAEGFLKTLNLWEEE